MDEETAMRIYEIMVNTNLILNGLTVGCGVLVVGIILMMHLIDRELVNRVSLRFTLAIALVDALRGLSFILYTNYKNDDILCSLLAYTNFWLTLLYLFFTVVIALNLQLVFVNGYTFDPAWERLYWMGSLGLSLLIPAVPLIFDKFGMDPNSQTCDLRDTVGPGYPWWIWCTFLVWIVLAMVYCTVVVVLTIINLLDKASVLDKISDLDPVTATAVKKSIRGLIFRVALYCIIPISTQLAHVILRVYETAGGDLSSTTSVVLQFASLITTDLPGVLNLLAFMVDPAFLNALGVLRQRNQLGQHLVPNPPEPQVELNALVHPPHLTSHEKDNPFNRRTSGLSEKEGGKDSNHSSMSRLVSLGTSTPTTNTNPGKVITVKSFVQGL